MAETKITVTKVSDKQKKKRIIIQNKLYELMDDMELPPGSKEKSWNRKEWERKFSQMSDLEFHKMMEKIYKERGYNFSFESSTITSKYKLSINRISEIAKKWGSKLTEYVVFPHKNRVNPNNPMVSKTELPIIVITVKRLQQMLSKKNKASSDNSVTNPVTGQVTGDSKAARLSNTQTFSLVTTNQISAVQEFLSVRADDDKAKREMLREIDMTGEAHLKNYKLSPAHKQSIQAMEVFLRAAGLYTNILKDTTIKSTEDLENDGIENSKKDIDFYKMLIFGEMHNNSQQIRITNSVIEKFKPKYILHEMVPPGDVISPSEAKQRLLDKQYLNHLKVEYQDVLQLGIKLNATLVGIDAEAVDLNDIPKNINNEFAIREHKMCKHIDQYYALPNCKIAVVVGDSHLRYFENYKDINIPSLITQKYRYVDDVLIIRIPEQLREIDRIENFKIIISDFVKMKNKFDNDPYKIIYKSKIIYKDKEKTPIGTITLSDNVSYKNEDGNISQVRFNNNEKTAKFLDIVLDKDFKNINFEKYIIDEIIKSTDALLKEEIYMIVNSDYDFIKDFTVISEIDNYFKIPNNYKCIKIK